MKVSESKKNPPPVMLSKKDLLFSRKDGCDNERAMKMERDDGLFLSVLKQKVRGYA